MLSPEEQTLAAAILAGAGLDASSYRLNPIRRRLPAILRALRTSGPVEGAAQLAAHNELARRALDALLIGHTVPFRDEPVFESLRDLVIPRLSHRRQPLRVWSAGCSVGDELLSVLMLLAAEGLAGSAVLRGSDCRAAAIAQARCRFLRFAECVPDRFADLRRVLCDGAVAASAERIEWCVEDILQSEPCAPWDLILCRNVTIYFRPEAAAHLWRKLAGALAPGGILITGKAERPNLPTLRNLARCVYEKETRC